MQGIARATRARVTALSMKSILDTLQQILRLWLPLCEVATHCP